jgi:hypothetical protein
VNDIRIINSSITRSELKEIAEECFGDMVKGAIDIEKEIIALGGELHVDEETLLVEEGSESQNVWGINLYPSETGEDFLEFDSMINIKPLVNNRSRSVEDEDIQQKIRKIVNKLIKK